MVAFMHCSSCCERGKKNSLCRNQDANGAPLEQQKTRSSCNGAPVSKCTSSNTNSVATRNSLLLVVFVPWSSCRGTETHPAYTFESLPHRVKMYVQNGGSTTQIRFLFLLHQYTHQFSNRCTWPRLNCLFPSLLVRTDQLVGWISMVVERCREHLVRYKNSSVERQCVSPQSCSKCNTTTRRRRVGATSVSRRRLHRRVSATPVHHTELASFSAMCSAFV